ncbi:MAG: hypothetical protein ACI376_08805 [Candidatus Bruticola sp.]
MELSQLIFVKCEICQGAGKVKCQNCQSGDFAGQKETNCLGISPEADGSRCECSVCHGKGVVICPGCCGGGYIDMPALA